jgi:hypothetical protein
MIFNEPALKAVAFVLINQLVVITDTLSNTTAGGAANERFSTVRSANSGEVLRGVSFTPGSSLP